MNILITGATTARAFQLERQLNRPDEIILADSAELPAFLLKSKRFLKIPGENSPSFVHELLALCLDEHIDEVYPLKEHEVEALNNARQLFEEYGIRIKFAGPSSDLNTQGNDQLF